MNWEAISTISEVIGAVAVVVSLIYLAAQIRQNTEATRAASYEDVAQGMQAFLALIAEDDDVADIYLRGAAKSEPLTPQQQVRFEMLMGHFFANFDVAVDLYRRRMIDDKMMKPYTRFAESLLAQRGVAEWWKTSGHFFSDELRAHLDASATDPAS